jgi:type II secretory pathway pseudopilin PulG
VEVIVVLVILAILAAIAIPALTGYINKAQSKSYITKARDVKIAALATLDIFYAEGKIKTTSESWTSGLNIGLPSGTRVWAFFLDSNFEARAISSSDSLDSFIPGITNEFTDLLDTEPFAFFIVGPTGSTPLTADGFICIYGEEGFTGASGDPVVWITHNISANSQYSRLVQNPPINITYDPNAGYEVHQEKYEPPFYG